MKVLIDVKDNKSEFVIELLKNLSFVKTEAISTSKAQFLKEFSCSVHEGVRGMAFIEAVVASSNENAKWVKL